MRSKGDLFSTSTIATVGGKENNVLSDTNEENSGSASSATAPTNATVGNAHRIVLNGDGGSRNVLTQEQIARSETNRLNALTIRKQKMLQNCVTSTAVNGGSHGALSMEQIERKNSN